MMKCPYCASGISDEASVCPHCTRDVYPFKPFLERITALEEKIRLLSEIEKGLDATVQSTSPALLGGSLMLIEENDSRLVSPLSPQKWFSMLLAPLALLLLAHLLITQLWDTSEWVIYAASIAIPLVPGYLLTRHYSCSLSTACVAGFTLAAVAVIGMSANTTLLDGAPFLPHGAREWKELVNFLLSIAFAYLSGAILGQVLHSRANARIEMLKRLANPASAKNINVELIQNSMERLDRIAKTALALSGLAASLYSGLGRFIGS